LTQDLASTSKAMDRFRALAKVYFPIQSGTGIRDIQGVSRQDRFKLKKNQVINEEEDEDDKNDMQKQFKKV